MNRRIIVLNIIIPILIGSLLYYVFEPDVLFVRWIDSIIPNGYHADIEHNLITSTVRNYLFDALWSYSLVFVVFAFNDCRRRILFSVLITVLLGWGLEVLQIWIPGTFDYLDMVVELSSSLVAGMIIYLKGER